MKGENYDKGSKQEILLRFLSHEVRKPIANIIGITRFLTDKNCESVNNQEWQSKLDFSLLELDRALNELENIYDNKKEKYD
ncbi:MAG: hypothetical protein R8N23_19110 [Reichenbachiella sp.]|uniref:hypothetical protein n=1 Tax=Reichenbachiella sp. TaxID=2184521 RepID=UPI0029672362|nr:hypothetical protein [Reichenbachiella sp.]MDW3211987.1 hypothetical protein [Reichenbachiella sp.]